MKKYRSTIVLVALGGLAAMCILPIAASSVCAQVVDNEQADQRAGTGRQEQQQNMEENSYRSDSQDREEKASMPQEQQQTGRAPIEWSPSVARKAHH